MNLIQVVIGVVCVGWGGSIVRQHWEKEKAWGLLVGVPLVVLGLFALLHAGGSAVGR